MPQPTLTDYLEAAEKHLTQALDAVEDARNLELAAAQECSRAPGMEDRHRRHMLANRALANSERLIREAMEGLL